MSYVSVYVSHNRHTFTSLRTDELTSVADFTNTLTIIINEDQPEHRATFTVPETLLTEKSEFFKAACRIGWQEASSRIIKIPEVDVGAFQAYIHWIYKEKVAVSSRHAPKAKFRNAAEAQPVFDDLVQLWLLADRLADAQLRNLASNAMLCAIGRIVGKSEDVTEAITPDTVALVWSRTTAGRALRRLIVDLYAQYVQPAILERIRDDLHPEFIKNIMMEAFWIKDGRQFSHPFLRGTCYYHEHEEHEDICCEQDVHLFE